MTKSYSDAYKAAGVDVTAGYQAVELMKKHVSRTTTSGVLDSIGGFGGLFAPDMTGMKKPVLVSGTDGVGTKLKLAMLLDKHDTVGIDCVAMCVNDVVCAGAQPLFFLDYIACGKNNPEKIAEIVKGVADGCVESGCALIGGETAEMPGFYPEDEYDLAGFTVGIVDEEKILDKNNVKAGDVMIGLASSGVHSNGFSLVRKVFDKSLRVFPRTHPPCALSSIFPKLSPSPSFAPSGSFPNPSQSPPLPKSYLFPDQDPSSPDPSKAISLFLALHLLRHFNT